MVWERPEGSVSRSCPESMGADIDLPSAAGEVWREEVHPGGSRCAELRLGGRSVVASGTFPPSLMFDRAGDPLYKVNPFYTVYNKSTKRWYGVFYNSLVDGTMDMGAVLKLPVSGHV